MYVRYFKRIIDFLISLVLLIVLSPICIIVSIVLLFANKGDGVFFIQERPGKDEKFFKLIKFKTMSEQKDKNGELLPAKDRLTPIGNFIRKTSIDEVPQLINVLAGDISLIGPRPLLIEYLDLYTENQRKRHNIKPGISGWAQVNGRNTVSWKQKLDYDIWYVDNLSFLLDCKIFFLSILKIFISDGIMIELTRPTRDDFR